MCEPARLSGKTIDQKAEGPRFESASAFLSLQKLWSCDFVTLKASLSGTFLQTLPELVTPLKGHVLFISAQLSTDAVSSLRKVWVLTNKTVEATHTPSIAFRHLPPNSARFSYATEGALFISAQLSSDAVSALRKVRVLI